MQDFIVSTEYDGQSRRLYKINCIECKKEFYAPKFSSSPTITSKTGTCQQCFRTCNALLVTIVNSMVTKRLYCSPECFHKTKQRSVIKICAQCGKEVRKTPSDLSNSKSGLVFCNRECKELAQRIGGIEEIQPDHYGVVGSYRRYKGNICERCGFVPENPCQLDVHHVDENHENNEQSNLQTLCANCHRLVTFCGRIVQSGERLPCTQECDRSIADCVHQVSLRHLFECLRVDNHTYSTESSCAIV